MARVRVRKRRQLIYADALDRKALTRETVLRARAVPVSPPKPYRSQPYWGLDWRAEAACRDMDVEVFFRRRKRAAVECCARCWPDVKAECLKDALATEGPEPNGYRAGMTAEHRLLLWRNLYQNADDHSQPGEAA